MDWFLYDNGLRHERVKEVTDFYRVFFVKHFKKIKRSKSLQKAEAHLEPKRASAMELFYEYI